jgi:glycosyltransferase involved in cell wall biosynthesis
MKPLVSILIPAYNAQEFLADTLRSAIGQTWDRKEIIVVDDGSKDQTLTIARQFASDTVRVVTQKNQGASAARNKAYSLSQGEYIQWLDADDLLAPDKVARQMAAAESCSSKRTLLSSAWARFLYRPERARFKASPLWADLSRAEWLMRKMENNVYMQTATWLVSREISEAAGPWDTRLLGDDDGEYFCRILLASEGTRFVPESKVFYRMAGAASLSYIGTSDRKRDAQWLSMKLHIGYLRSLEDSERVRAACVQYMQTWLVYFYPERPDLVQEMGDLARSLGGTLVPPRLSWKYSWIDAIFGRKLAKRAQRFLPGIRWSVERWRDKTLFQFDSRRRGGNGVLEPIQ